MAKVYLRGVYKYYEKNPTPAVSDFNLEIADKEFIVFVGPSGCGKSTTLRMIAGLEMISDGDIYIDDKLVNDVEPKDRDIAMVFQNYALYPHMTVYNNISFGLMHMKKTVLRTEWNGDPVLTVDNATIKNDKRKLKEAEKTLSFYKKYDNSEMVEKYTAEVDALSSIVKNDTIKLEKDLRTYKKYLEARKVWLSACKKYGKESSEASSAKAVLDENKAGLIPIYDHVEYSKEEIKEKVMEAAKTLEIEEYLKRKPKEVSGGQRQRVAIGRAIVRKPKVFLMDEPLSNLDAKLRNQMRAEIIELRKKVQTTFIYVTHDQVEAMTLGDRIVIMKDGFVQQIGTPAEVFETPANIFVAGFIGAPQMNFFDAALVKEVNEYFVELCGVKFRLPAAVNEKFFRENQTEGRIVLGVRPEHITLTNSKNDSVSARVKISEMMGSEAHIHVVVNDKDVIIRVQTLGLDKDIAGTIRENGEIRFTFSSEVMHVFDKETGVSLI